LVVADRHWTFKPIDVQVGDSVILPMGTQLEGTCIAAVDDSHQRIVATALCPGIGRASNDALDWSSYVRVAQQQYVGRSIFRFDEEIIDND
jgi:hypothetical protein